MWKQGIIACPATNEKYEYWVKNFENGSEFGIDEGKISKLTIRKYGRNTDLANFDRGWDVEPTEEVKTVYAILLQKYN